MREEMGNLSFSLLLRGRMCAFVGASGHLCDLDKGRLLLSSRVVEGLHPGCGHWTGWVSPILGLS